MGDGACRGHHGELAVVVGVPADRGVHGPVQRVRGGPGPARGRPCPRCASGMLLQHPVAVLGLGDHHHAGGADVEPLHDALPLGGPAGGDPEPGGDQGPMTVGPVQPGLGWTATPTGLSTTTIASSSCTILMPSTISGTTATGSTRRGCRRRASPPARPGRTWPAARRRRGPGRHRPARRPGSGRSRTSARARRRGAPRPGRPGRGGCGGRGRGGPHPGTTGSRCRVVRDLGVAASPRLAPRVPLSRHPADGLHHDHDPRRC